ncbi:glycosyltransferase family 2 protein [Candidatus Woesearchaeota archaeon]|nr:glycosyltransferase family 2 protein [Candidatus Woesearchaeota archaeon]
MALLKMGILEQLAYVITVLFLIVVVSYYVLLFIKRKKPEKKKKFSSITIIIPAHNEETYIRECIESVISADFSGKKEIIVVDDGSRDKTSSIAREFRNVRLIRTAHSGKSASINKALSAAKGEIIAIVDADSTINKNGLAEVAEELSRDNVAGVCSVVKVRNRDKFVCMWVHIEQLYNSLMRLLFSKIGANITTPGPLSAYVKKNLVEIGGFSAEGFSEDIDVAVRLIRKGSRISFAEGAVSETNMPYDLKGFFRQRTRFARGVINILKKHVQLNNTIIDLYTLPIFLFTYVQAVVMGSFTLYQIISGYITYFFSKGIYFNIYVLRFFFEWLSIVGFIRWTVSVFSGQTPLTLAVMAGLASTFLTYPLILLAIFKFDRKFDFRHLIPFVFMFPFWLLIMCIYITCLPEYFRKRQPNIWKKNE